MKDMTMLSHTLPWREDKNVLKVMHLQLLSHVYIETVGDKRFCCLSLSIYIPNELRCENAVLPKVFI
jgi:hypothetical protein